MNFTHPPKTGCQNPCRNGFFIRSEGERGGAEENRRRGEGEEKKKKKQEAEREKERQREEEEERAREMQ